LQRRLLAAIARRTAAHIHFAFSPDRCGVWTRLVRRLRSQGVSTSWDFGWDPALLRRIGFIDLAGEVDVLFINEIEAALYARTRPTCPTHPTCLARPAMKIAVIGGAGVRTPLLVEGLTNSDLPIDEIALYDVDRGRLETIGAVAERMAAKGRVTRCASLREAI